MNKRKAVLVKLSSLKNAVNYVLRHRMQKSAAESSEWDLKRDDVQYKLDNREVDMPEDKIEALRRQLELYDSLPEELFNPALNTEEGRRARQQRVNEHYRQLEEDAVMEPEDRFAKEYDELYGPAFYIKALPGPRGSKQTPLPVLQGNGVPEYIYRSTPVVRTPTPRTSNFSKLDKYNVSTKRNPYYDNSHTPIYKKFSPFTQKGKDNISTFLFGVPSVKTTSEDSKQDFLNGDLYDFQKYLMEPYDQQYTDDKNYVFNDAWDVWEHPYNLQLPRGKTMQDLGGDELNERHIFEVPNGQGGMRRILPDYNFIRQPESDIFRRYDPIPRPVLQANAARSKQYSAFRDRFDTLLEVEKDLNNSRDIYSRYSSGSWNPYYKYFGKFDRSPAGVYQFNEPNKRRQMAYSYIDQSPIGRLYHKYPNPFTEKPYKLYKTLFHISEGLQTPKAVTPMKRFRITPEGNYTVENKADMPEPPAYYYSPSK